MKQDGVTLNMLKQFENPELQVQMFQIEDVITASGGLGGDGDSSGSFGGGAWEEELPR